MIKILLKQIRIIQWSKNLILFFPVLANHQIFEFSVIKNSFVGFIAFSLIASSVYMLNDIIDLEHDRSHPRKKHRPLASGLISIKSGYLILATCFLSSVVVASFLGIAFLIIICIYFILNILYSFFVKKVIILDIIFIMSFYTLRLIAGHIPDSIPFSSWLISFFIFLFFSLGLLKRYSDLIILNTNSINSSSGRDYLVEDGNILMSLGISSGLISTLVLILYTGSDEVLKFYSEPIFLVSLAPVMLYWNSRIWMLAKRGEIKVDPVLYVIKDYNTYIIILIFLIIILISKHLVI
jgi:4-hydroxybenzoate polyprenyltransferase